MRQIAWQTKVVLMSLMLGAWVLGAVTAEARMLKLRRLTPIQEVRLNKESRKLYDLGWAAIDKINYTKAFKFFGKAVEAEPKNVYLRYLVVQLARYLGDSHFGAKSIKYYDQASLNLKKMSQSSQLNKREQERAKKSLRKVNNLRATVTERDQKRYQWGLELAKYNMRQLKKQDEAEQERADKAEGKIGVMKDAIKQRRSQAIGGPASSAY
jgi:hypothetical protein